MLWFLPVDVAVLADFTGSQDALHAVPQHPGMLEAMKDRSGASSESPKKRAHFEHHSNFSELRQPSHTVMTSLALTCRL